MPPPIFQPSALLLLGSFAILLYISFARQFVRLPVFPKETAFVQHLAHLVHIHTSLD